MDPVEQCQSCGNRYPPAFTGDSCPACMMPSGSRSDAAHDHHRHHEIGQQISHYKLAEKLGEGNLGLAWSAEDSQQKRKVIIKFLPDSLTDSAEHLQRFQREASVLATLNHPHLSALYGIEGAENDRFLVMEYVPGESLVERLARGFTAPEAFKLAGQLAQGLAAAHEHGILHRDLKPANIKVTPEGELKVLDFGLAQALDTEFTSAPALTASQMPTATTATAEPAGHVTLETAPYMSPEQAGDSRFVDKRTDIWAFGCLFYEMLTGRRAFSGPTVQDIFTAITTRDPDWRKLPAKTPPRIRKLLRRCLEKDPDRRLHDISDARLEIEDAVTEGEEGFRETHRPRMTAWLLAASTFAALLAGAVVGTGWNDEETRNGNSGRGVSGVGWRDAAVRFRHEIPGASWMVPEVSPDGRSIAIAYNLKESKPEERDGFTMNPWELVLHSIETNTTMPVAGAEGLWNQDALLGDRPQFTFSPDSQWLAYTVRDRLPVRRTRLFKVRVDGTGEPVPLATWRWDEEGELRRNVMGLTGFGRSLAWLDDDPDDSNPGTIVGLVGKVTWNAWWKQFLLRVSADGVTPQKMLPLGITDATVIDLEVVPGAGRLLARGYKTCQDKQDCPWSGKPGEPGYGKLASIDPVTAETQFIDTRWPLGEMQWSPSGHLVFWARGANRSMAVPFDPDALQFTGPPVPLPSAMSLPHINARFGFSISASGHLAWPRMFNEVGRPYIGRVDHDGSIQTIVSADALEDNFIALASGLRISDTGNIAVFRAWRGEETEVWGTRLDQDGLWQISPPGEWCSLTLSSDGRFLLCNGGPRGTGVTIIPTDGSDLEGEFIAATEAGCVGETNFSNALFATDHQWLLGQCAGADPAWRLVSVTAEGGARRVIPLPALRPDIAELTISADGHWLAYGRMSGNQPQAFARRLHADGKLGHEIQVTRGGVLWGKWIGPDSSGKPRLLLKLEAGGPFVAMTIDEDAGSGIPDPVMMVPDTPSTGFTMRGRRPTGTEALLDGRLVSILVHLPEKPEPSAIMVHLNWAGELESAMPRELAANN